MSLGIRKQAICALMLLLCACNNPKSEKEKPQSKAPSIVSFIIIEEQPIDLQQELSGRVNPYLISEVRPQVSGIVKQRNFEEGSKVFAGQTLYTIESSNYLATVKSNSASLEQANANLEAAKIKLARYSELVAINGVSKQELDDAKTALKIATANVKLQNANLELARINLRYTNVLAPITGRIGKSNLTKGALVTANQTAPLATIVDISRVYVDITQSSADNLRLRKQFEVGALNKPYSASASLILSDGSQFNQFGALQFSDLSVDPSTGNVTLRALFPNPEGILLPGMFVRAIIAKGTFAKGILIPQNCVNIDQQGKASVFLIDGENKAQKTNIGLGEMIGDKWQITSGLKAGDKLIVQGGAKLKNGVTIKPNLQKPQMIKSSEKGHN